MLTQFPHERRRTQGTVPTLLAAGGPDRCLALDMIRATIANDVVRQLHQMTEPHDGCVWNPDLAVECVETWWSAFALDAARTGAELWARERAA